MRENVKQAPGLRLYYLG